MKNYSVEEIIKGVKRRNNEVFKYLYKEVYPSIKKLIRDFQGNEDDAKDIFQESLIILYRKACEPGFQLNSSIKSFLYSVGKNIWYQKMRNKEVFKEEMELVEEESGDYQDNEFFANDLEINESLKIGLLQKYFRKLDRFCQKLLQLFYKGSSHEQISIKLKISNDISRKKKKECLDNLTSMITSDPEYKSYYGT